MMFHYYNEIDWAKAHLEKKPKPCVSCPFRTFDLDIGEFWICSLLDKGITEHTHMKGHKALCTPYDFTRYLLEEM